MAFSNNFEGIKNSLTDVSQQSAEELCERVNSIHVELSNQRYVLNKSIKRVGESTESAKRSGSHKQSSSNRSGNLANANFALAHLCVVTQNDIIDVPVFNNIFGRQQRIYDSCCDGTHNFIPGTQEAMEQWKYYLGEEASILESAQHLKDLMTIEKVELENSVDNFQQQCQERDSEQAVATLDGISNAIKNYHNYGKKWINSGWHCEQRILYDMDSPEICEVLEEIHGKQKCIKHIISCIHTRLAPCVSQPDKKSCDCYNCLKNWSSRWKFIVKHPEIRALMTVSFIDYHTISNQYQFSNESSFFLEQIADPTFETDAIRGLNWLNDEISFSLHHINYFKTTLNRVSLLNFYERDLMQTIWPLILHCKVRYEGDKNLMMEYGGISLQRRYDDNRNKCLVLNGFFGLQKAEIRLIDWPTPLELFADETDWSLLLKFYALTFLSS